MDGTRSFTKRRVRREMRRVFLRGYLVGDCNDEGTVGRVERDASRWCGWVSRETFRFRKQQDLSGDERATQAMLFGKIVGTTEFSGVLRKNERDCSPHSRKENKAVRLREW